jgi:hypothetical protein
MIRPCQVSSPEDDRGTHACEPASFAQRSPPRINAAIIAQQALELKPEARACRAWAVAHPISGRASRSTRLAPRASTVPEPLPCQGEPTVRFLCSQGRSPCMGKRSVESMFSRMHRGCTGDVVITGSPKGNSLDGVAPQAPRVGEVLGVCGASYPTGSRCRSRRRPPLGSRRRTGSPGRPGHPRCGPRSRAGQPVGCPRQQTWSGPRPTRRDPAHSRQVHDPVYAAVVAVDQVEPVALQVDGGTASDPFLPPRAWIYWVIPFGGNCIAMP